MTKEKVIAAIKDMPQDFHLDLLIEKLIIIEKIDAAEQQVREGEVTYHTEVKKKIEEWKKK